MYFARRLKKTHVANRLILVSCKISNISAFMYLKVNYNFWVCEYWVGLSVSRKMPLKNRGGVCLSGSVS